MQLNIVQIMLVPVFEHIFHALQIHGLIKYAYVVINVSLCYRFLNQQGTADTEVNSSDKLAHQILITQKSMLLNVEC